MEVQDTYKQISDKTGIEYDLVKEAIQYVFQFTANVMRDPEDTHDILFNKLFKFKLKSKFRNNGK